MYSNMFSIGHSFSYQSALGLVPLYLSPSSAALWLLPFALVSYLLYLRHSHPLSSVPGPFFASITRLWLVQATLARRRHYVEADLHKKYGSVVRISPNELSISDPTYLHELYGAHSQFTKSDWYLAVAPKNRKAMNLLGESDMEKHRLQRRLIGPMFTTQAIKTYEPLMDEPISRFVAKMREKMCEPQDLCMWMNILALDLLTEVTFSTSPNYIDAGDDAHNSREIDAFWQQISWVGLLPRFWHAYVWLSGTLASVGLPLLPLKREASSLSIIKFFLSQIASPETKNPPPATNLSSSIKLASTTHPEFTPLWATTLTLHIVGAGFDILGMTLSCILTSIARTPNCQKTLQQELDTAREANALSPMPSYDQASTLPYLSACITESLRLHPVIGTTLPRTVPASGARIAGHAVPAGTVMGMNPRVVQRDTGVFGADAATFNPQRYLCASVERLRAMHAASLAFGGPSRSCLGQYLARVAVWKVVARVFLYFELKVLDKEEAERLGCGGFMEESFFVVKWYGVWVRMRPREESGSTCIGDQEKELGGKGLNRMRSSCILRACSRCPALAKTSKY